MPHSVLRAVGRYFQAKGEEKCHLFADLQVLVVSPCVSHFVQVSSRDSVSKY